MKHSLVAMLGSMGVVLTAGAQTPGGPTSKPSCMPTGFFTAPATYRSADVQPDGRVTFRLCAPDATSAMVTSSDYAPAIPMGGPGALPGLAMTKDSMGLWAATTAVPIEPGTYRYNFRVNGARVPDPQSTRFSDCSIPRR